MCDESFYYGKYIFDKMFDPNNEFDDEKFADTYEVYSPIFISTNKGPMIFIANNFT